MPCQEVLIMAMTRMRSGICTAGFLPEPDPVSHWQWVRPVKAHGTLLLGDMTDAKGRVIQVGDVVALNLLEPRPDPPHGEDWVTDFVRRRPRLVRQLTDAKRADFLTMFIDRSPAQVFAEQRRSLCLIQPSEVWARFCLDPYTSKYEAQMGFQVTDMAHTWEPTRSVAVTDIKWRALGRRWLAEAGSDRLYLDPPTLLQRLHADALYLSIGLGRTFQNTHWLLVIGVHTMPDYQAFIDYTNFQ